MTAYEMRISDWSSDVCSSDLSPPPTDARPWASAPTNNSHRREPAPLLRRKRRVWGRRFDLSGGVRVRRGVWRGVGGDGAGGDAQDQLGVGLGGQAGGAREERLAGREVGQQGVGAVGGEIGRAHV